MTLLGRKDLPPNNRPELITYLKANSSKINLAHAGLGAVSHLCGMVFRQAIGVELQTVPYQGTAPALNALLGGQVDLLCDQTTQTTQHIKAETVKLYGVTTLERIKALPNAPTLNELGAVIVPDAKQTPAGLQTWLAEETARYAPVIKAAGQFAD